MADDRNSKRPKTISRSSVEDSTNDARVISLESEIHSLRSENARLRQQLQWFEGHHDVLPVVVPTPTRTVDISRLDTSLVTHVVTFLGTSLELLNVALTCKAFGWQQPASGLDWSIADEVARRVVHSWRNDIEGVRIKLPQYVRSTTTWLSILHESEHPLKFRTLLGNGIEYHNGRRTLVRGISNDIAGTAIASNYIMVSGEHYAEFRVTGNRPFLGIVRPMSNLDPDRFSNDNFHFFDRALCEDLLFARSDEWGSGNVHACQYCCEDGDMIWTNWEREDLGWDEWEGMEDCKTGDTVGMRLNLDKGTLTVYKNSRRLGVMKDGLSGSYCWFATVIEVSKVGIRRSGAGDALNGEVIQVIRNLSCGVIHVNAVVGQLSQKGFSEADIMSSIEHLDNEGHIYSTIDEDHYQYAE